MHSTKGYNRNILFFILTDRYLASVASQSKKVIKSGDGMQESFQSDSTDVESPIISYDPTSGK